MSMMVFLSLLIYSCIGINLLLQCALGIKEVTECKNPLRRTIIIKYAILFFSCFLLWILFSRIISSIVTGIYIYVLLFPLSLIVYESIEFLVFRYLIKKDAKEEDFIDFPGGIAAVSAFFCVNIAENFLQAFVLSLGFTLGVYLINVILMEVKKRAALEKIPVFLRGKPLVLITMGLLSLAFSAVSMLLFRVIGVR